ncbi:MAG: ArsR/SmtB family transcription factor [Candidatus Nanohaloarchaea archaeon]
MGYMGRKSSRELVGDIAEALTSEPQSIQKISDEVGADRQSVTKYLEELEDAGIVNEDRSGRTRKFYVSEYEDNEAYFQLPLKNEEKEKFRALFRKILDEYREQFDKIPGKLTYQKIAVSVIKDLGLELPHGRYQFGSITAMNYTPGDGESAGPVDFGPGFSESELDESVRENVREYGELGFHDARKKQYEDEDMELYLKKEEIMEQLAGQIEDRKKFERDLYSFLSKTPELEEKHEDALIDFIAVSTDLLDEASHRARVIETFQELWELIAFYCLEEDMSEYYDKEVLESRMENDRKEKWDEVEQALTELISLHKDVKEYEISEEMQDVGGEKISEEERKRREDELEGMDSSDVAREFDLES